jgi:hypothetical protein
MKIWIIRGKYNRQALVNNTLFWNRYQNEYDKKYTDGQYLYWTRDSRFDKKELASIQVNRPSANRAFKRAKEYCFDWILNIELVEIEIALPNEE